MAAVLETNDILKRAAAKKLEHVRTLNCWGSKLENVQVLRLVENVEVLNLSSNLISTLEDVAYCVKLRELYIRRNNISSFAELEHLQKLPNLRVLWLSENPVVGSSGYRSRVIQMLPQLTKLDNKVITDEERKLARLNMSTPTQRSETSNITTAVLCLLKELTKNDLLIIKNSIETKLQEE